MPTALTHAEAVARAHLIDVRSYSVALDLTADPVRVRTEIEFGCREPGVSTFADVDALSVRQVLLNGEQLDAGSIADGRLMLERLVPQSELIVEADIHYARGDRGLVRFTDPADGSQYVFVNCFPTAAPSVFCCFDQPDLRADLTLAVTVPANWQCVANGSVVEQMAAKAGAVTWQFSTVPAVKPYDVTFCAGPYVTAAAHAASETASGRQLTVRCRPALAGSPGLARIATIVDRAVAYYQDLLGVACPYDKLDIAFVPELGPTAMQVPAVMYASEPLLQRAADHRDDFVAEVLAHEAAHLWFGCLVEARWWGDDWLAEAMATYLSQRALAEDLGLANTWAEFAMSGKASAYLADSLPSTVPVSSTAASAADALTGPTVIRYSKGASVIRQLAALIGDDAMRDGLRDYLTSYAWSSTSVDDIVRCWSKASGRDLVGWARQWFKLAGVNTLRPEIVTAPDGTVTAAAVIQDPPPGDTELRTHRISIGVYSGKGSRLSRDDLIGVEVSGTRTDVPGLVGKPRPAAVVVNDADLTFARTRLDHASLGVLAQAAMNVGDPLGEAVCWNAVWDMVQAAELPAALFVGLVGRRLGGGFPAGGQYLLDSALRAADYYADPRSRSSLRRELAAACLTAANRAEPTTRVQRMLAFAFAQSAEGHEQLDLLRAWLGSRSLLPGLALELELHAKILASLAARDLATEDDLAAYADADPVSGDTQLATCRARRPTQAAKMEAWVGALAGGQSPRLARAHANGFWLPGQEELVSQFRERYFDEALPEVRRLGGRTAQRLARALYPATLADEATLDATDAELRQAADADPVTSVLLEQRAILQQVIAARRESSVAVLSEIR